MAELDGTDEYFDSRDVIARIAEIEDEYIYESTGGDVMFSTDMPTAVLEEYETLRGLRDEAEINIADWKYGETFVADEYFETYAREFAEDIGAVTDNTEWPYDYIDWVSAASALKQDYTGFLFRGTMYWAR